MLHALILVCAVGTSHADCTRDNAINVLSLPIESANPSTCFMQAQAYFAETSLPHDGETIKIICTREG